MLQVCTSKLSKQTWYDIANFVKKTHFDDKVKNLNKKVTSNEIKHVLVENELKN